MPNISFAGVTLAFNVPAVTQIDPNFKEFICNSSHVDCNVCFEGCESFPELNGEILYSETSFDVLKLYDGIIIRRFHKHLHEDQCYAYTIMDGDNQRSTIYYLVDCPLYLRDMNQCFSLSNWEKLMIHRGRIILHSALIRSNYGGIAFMGPSGIGKSTQASLWVDFERAELINGDQPIYYCSDNSWKGCGAPFAGSSYCYLNEQVLMKAIVILEQGRSCSVSRLSLRDAFRHVYSNCTAYCWDSEFMNQVVTLISNLISEVPVYHLICTPDQAAVEALKTVLAEEMRHERN